MIRFVLMTLLGVLLLAHPIPARAAVNAAGAAHLKDIFTRYLEERKSAMKASHQELKTEGPLTVEPAGTYYAITLPHLSVYRPDGSYTDIGIFAINVLPGAKSNEWKITLAAPTPIIGYDATKTPELRIDLGKQTFNGIWDENIESFSKLDAQYQNTAVEQIKDGMVVKIPQTTIVYNLIPDAGGKTWSGPVKYEMSNIDAVKKGDAGISKIGSIIMDMNVRNYDPARVKLYQQKIAELTIPVQKTPAAPLAPDQLKNVYSAFFDFMDSAWSGFDSKITINNIALSRPAVSGAPAGSFNLKQAVFGFDMNGFRTGAVTMHVNLGYDGLALIPPPEGFNDTVPTHLNLNMTGDKIPLKELTDLGIKNMQLANTTPDAKRASGMQMAQIIPQLLTQAGTTMTISQSTLGNNTYTILMNGQLDANLKAIMGATGKARLEVSGFEQLLKMVQDEMKDPRLTQLGKTNLQKTLVTMTVLQTAGQLSKNAQGQPIRTYDIELTDQGKLMLNGADMSLLLAMANAASGAQNPAPMSVAPARPKP